MSKLHIWGELDDLPSIDAESIATLAYLIHFGELGQCEISSQFDPSQSPNGDFPSLQVGGINLAGFSAIRDRIGHRDSELSPAEQANIEAWSSFIQQRGQALLDLYFYVSSSNYWDTISPAFTKILPWYSNYIIPPARRKAAIARTNHLGIRSLDLDSIDEYAAGDDVRIEGSKPSTLTGPKTPEELLKKQKSAKWLRNQQHSDTFQLYQLTKAFFGPLEELLGEKKYLLSEDGPTSVDCVAVGFLSLMRYTSVPQPWLADAIKSRFPKLDAYTARVYKETFENPDRAWKSRLSRAPAPTASQAATIIGTGLLHFTLPSSKKFITADSSHVPQKSTSSTSFFTPSLLFPVAALAGLALGIMKYISISSERGKNTFTAQEHDYLTPSKLSDLGEAGSIFSSAFGRTQAPQLDEREAERMGGTTVVEIDVENESGEVGRDVIMKK